MRSLKSLAVLTGVLSLALALCAGPMRRGEAAQRVRNVVIMIGDDHGLDLGCYGNPEVRTPHLDALAQSGTRFTQAFCTTASCSPSRAVLLSGLHSHTNGMYGLQHATHKQTSHAWVTGMPNLLTAAGYRTAIVGKYHVAPEARYKFETVLPAGPGGGRSAVQMAEAAETWIRKEPGKPFFLYYSSTDPHRSQKDFGNERPYPGVDEVRYDPDRLKVPPFLPDTPECRRELARYYQAVTRLDQGVGRLMKALRDTGHDRDTLVIYLSDNGIPFPGAKTTLYEPGCRLPLIVSSPDQTRRGHSSSAMVSWVDVLPTVLQYSGAAPPSYPLQGRSFLGILNEENPAGWDEVYGSHQFHEVTMYYPMRMLRTRRHKLIQNLAHPLEYPFASDLWESETWQGVLKNGLKQYGKRSVQALLHRPRWELYDLENDPHEVQNLAESPGHAKLLEELRQRMRAWQEKTDDPWAIKYRHE